MPNGSEDKRRVLKERHRITVEKIDADGNVVKDADGEDKRVVVESDFAVAVGIDTDLKTQIYHGAPMTLEAEIICALLRDHQWGKTRQDVEDMLDEVLPQKMMQILQAEAKRMEGSGDNLIIRPNFGGGDERG